MAQIILLLPLRHMGAEGCLCSKSSLFPLSLPWEIKYKERIFRMLKKIQVVDA